MKYTDQESIKAEMEKELPLFNPLLKDFSIPFKGDDNKEIILTMKGGQVTYFKGYQAQYMIKHLSDEIFNEMGYPKTNSEDDYKEIRKMILV